MIRPSPTSATPPSFAGQEAPFNGILVKDVGEPNRQTINKITNVLSELFITTLGSASVGGLLAHK